MVEVDVFWSYGLGAGFAFASARQAKGATFREQTFEGTHFRDTLLYLALAFAPSGVALVWAFPSWETMHVGSREMPHWLVALFAATNVSQGLLGFAVTRWLFHTGRPFAAYLQWWLGYFCMFFILVHGWDGSGFQRFFSATPVELQGWSWSTAARWFTSDVALTLLVEGVFVVPPILWWMTGWAKAGHRDAQVSRGALVASVLVFSLLVFPLTAVVASVLIRQLGWLPGFVAFGLVVWLLGLTRRGVFHRHFAQLLDGVPFFTTPVPSPGVAQWQR